MNAREIRGQEIAHAEGQVKRVTDYYYSVRSQRETRKNYNIERKAYGWECTCPDFVFRRVKCKHIFAAEFSISYRKVVEVRKIEPVPSDVSTCLFCKSNEIVKQGLRHNKSGDIQKFGCKICGKYFTVNIGFEKMKHNPQAVASAIQLYFSGESLRNVTKSLKLLGVDVVHSTVYKWIGKYTELMGTYLDKIVPQVSNTWRADEIYVKVKGLLEKT
jgi:putative transposase